MSANVELTLVALAISASYRRIAADSSRWQRGVISPETFAERVAAELARMAPYLEEHVPA